MIDMGLNLLMDVHIVAWHEWLR